MALGLHRSQVVSGNNAFTTRLKLTFWTIYYMERTTAMLSGRPTCLPEDHIDAPYPVDLPDGLDNRPAQFAYIRAMAVIGKISDNVATANYLPKHMRRLSDLSTSNRINYECTGELHCLIETLPDYLRFSDRNAPVREVWQEVQRTSLGVTYYITQILIFRPALVYATFFDSLTLAQDSIGDRIDIRKYMDLALLSAKNLIGLAHDVFFVRCPSFKRDGNMAVGILIL